MAHESGPAADEGDGGNGTAVAGGVGMNRLRDKLEECLGASKALTTPECAARLREVMAEEYGLVGRIALARIVQANCDDSATRENVRSIVPSSDSQPGVLRLLVQWIDEAHQEHKNSALNRMLSALKALPITVEDLSATNAGTVVNKLKRSEGVDNECKQTASDIVKRWRTLAKGESDIRSGDSGSSAASGDQQKATSSSAAKSKEQSGSGNGKQAPGVIESGDDADLFGQMKRKASSSTVSAVNESVSRKRQQTEPQASDSASSKHESKGASSSGEPHSSAATRVRDSEARAQESDHRNSATPSMSTNERKEKDSGGEHHGSRRAGILKKESESRHKKHRRATFAPKHELQHVTTFVRLGDEGRTPIERLHQQQQQQQEQPSEGNRTQARASSSKAEGDNNDAIKLKKGSKHNGSNSSVGPSSRKKKDRFMTPASLKIDPEWEVKAGDASREKHRQEQREKERGAKRIVKATADSPSEPSDEDATPGNGEVPVIPAVSLGPPPSVSSGDTSAPIAAPAPKTSSVVPSQPQDAPPGFAAPSSTQQAPSTGLQLNANNMTSLLASLINTTGSARPPEQQQRTQTRDKDGNGPPGFASSPVQGAVPAQSDMAMSAPPGFAPKVSQQGGGNKKQQR